MVPMNGTFGVQKWDRVTFVIFDRVSTTSLEHRPTVFSALRKAPDVALVTFWRLRVWLDLLPGGVNCPIL